MNTSPQRNPNPALGYTLIGLGILCFLGTILAAVFLKNNIIEVVREPEGISGLTDSINIQTLEKEIEFKESRIELEKKMLDIEEFKRKMEEEKNKISNNKNKTNANSSIFGENKADKIKNLEKEKAELIAKKNELIEKVRAKKMRPRTWGEWFQDYNLKFFLGGVVPLALFSLFLGQTAVGRLPDRNPLSLADFERRSLLFLIFSVVFSAFVFFLFVWILTILY